MYIARGQIEMCVRNNVQAHASMCICACGRPGHFMHCNPACMYNVLCTCFTRNGNVDTYKCMCACT